MIMQDTKQFYTGEYAAVEGTKILMADLSEKSIEDVKKGDLIIGFDEKLGSSGSRRTHSALVLDVGSTEEVDYYYNFKTKDRELGLSASHPLLNQNNIFVTAEDFYNDKSNDKKVYTDIIPRRTEQSFSNNYKIGYIISCWLSEGIFGKYNDDSYMSFYFNEVEVLNRLIRFMVEMGFTGIMTNTIDSLDCFTRSLRIDGNANGAHDKLVDLIKDNVYRNTSGDYYTGFLAGIYDLKGECRKSNIHEFSTSNTTIIDEITSAVDYLNQELFIDDTKDNDSAETIHTIYEYTQDNKYLTVRATGEVAQKTIERVCPACLAKYAVIEDNTLYTLTDVVIEKVNEEKKVYNLTTSSSTFIANGILVHNCYEIERA